MRHVGTEPVGLEEPGRAPLALVLLLGRTGVLADVLLGLLHLGERVEAHGADQGRVVGPVLLHEVARVVLPGHERGLAAPADAPAAVAVEVAAVVGGAADEARRAQRAGVVAEAVRLKVREQAAGRVRRQAQRAQGGALQRERQSGRAAREGTFSSDTVRN